MGNILYLMKKCWGVVDRLDGVEDNKLDMDKVNPKNVVNGAFGNYTVNDEDLEDDTSIRCKSFRSEKKF